MTGEESEILRKRVIEIANAIGFGRHAEDLAQAVLLRLVENPENHRRQLRHLLYDCIRKDVVDRRRTHQVVQVGLYEKHWNAIKDPSETHLISVGFEKLSDRERVLVILRGIYGFTGEELCMLLGMTETNVALVLAEGRAKLTE